MKGFVFDLDNTLYDRYGTIEAFTAAYWDEFKAWVNPAYSLERATEHLCHTESLFILENGWKSWYEHLVSEKFFDHNNTPDYSAFDAFLRKGFSNYALNFPFTANVLVKLKETGYKLGILTNASDVVFQNRKLDILGIRDHFDAIVISGEYAQQDCGDTYAKEYYKPNPKAFLYTAELLGVKAEELYYVGDNPIADVQGAINSGYTPVWIKSRYPWTRTDIPMPKLSFESIESLTELI